MTQHLVGLAVTEGAPVFELAIPCEVFGRFRDAGAVVGVGLTGLAPDRENVWKLERLTTALGL